MKLLLRHKGGEGSGYHGHQGGVGGPGNPGGSQPRGATRSIGAKPLQYYIDIVNSAPWKTISPRMYGNDKTPPYKVKDLGEYVDTIDYPVLSGVEYEMRMHETNFPGETFEEYIEHSEDAFREQLAASEVYMRITPKNLEQALREGEFENTFTAKHTGADWKGNRITYKTYIEHRKLGENMALDVSINADDRDRPIYGYWSKEGAFTKTNDPWLDQYGTVAVEFNKDAIADDLTFTDSDSLDMHGRVKSSDWRQPSILSSYGLTNQTYVPDIADRGPNDSMFWEAQIFSKKTSNIRSVTSKTTLPESLTKLLDEAGIPWSIKS